MKTGHLRRQVKNEDGQPGRHTRRETEESRETEGKRRTDRQTQMDGGKGKERKGGETKMVD
jgi:hypothetical protein